MCVLKRRGGGDFQDTCYCQQKNCNRKKRPCDSVDFETSKTLRRKWTVRFLLAYNSTDSSNHITNKNQCKDFFVQMVKSEILIIKTRDVVKLQLEMYFRSLLKQIFFSKIKQQGQHCKAVDITSQQEGRRFVSHVGLLSAVCSCTCYLQVLRLTPTDQSMHVRLIGTRCE